MKDIYAKTLKVMLDVADEGTGEVISRAFPLPYPTQPVKIKDWTLQASRMGTAPQITCSFMHPLCLDKEQWREDLYVLVGEERFYLKRKPFASKDNSSKLYKYDAEFVSERSKLDNVLFLDVYAGDGAANQYHTNSPSFTFYGTLGEYVARIKESLKSSGLYSVNGKDGGFDIQIDDAPESGLQEISVSNQTITGALQQIPTLFGLPYRFEGRVCHIGYPTPINTTPLAYGSGNGLLEITRSHANDRIVNRITGSGGSENIPYYYPNETADRDSVSTWITPTGKLMPSVYRESKGKERFYNAENTNDSDYTYENPYTPESPKEAYSAHDDIYPSIEGMTNSSGQLLGSLGGVAWDEGDNDNTAGDSYEHSYFYVKLRKFDGPNGFNLFEHALENGSMTFEMTSGKCAGCRFEVVVSDPRSEDGKYVFDNPVQVDEWGHIVDGGQDEKIRFDNLQEAQQNTMLHEVWVALRKEESTYGILMPNATNGYYPETGDQFVITNIKLPQSYIWAAEKALDAALKKDLYEQNRNKLNCSVKLSRVYLSRHPELIEKLNENSQVLIDFEGKTSALYVSSYSIRNSDELLQEVTIELSEDVESSGSGGLEAQIADTVEAMTQSQAESVLAKVSAEYLSKRKNDQAAGRITFKRGLTSQGETIVARLEVGHYTADSQSGIGAQNGILATPDGTIKARTLELSTSLSVPVLRYNQIDMIAGTRWDSAGNGKVKHVAVTDEENHRCSFILQLEDGQPGGFKQDDILRGYWHNLDPTQNSPQYKDDRHGNIEVAGFQSIYCRVTQVQDIIERTEGESVVYLLPDENYEAAEGDKLLSAGYVTVAARGYADGSYSPLPQTHCALCVTGSFSTREADQDRKNFFVYTRQYSARYEKVSSWEWEDSNLMGAWGNLDGFTMYHENEDGSIYKQTHSGEGFITKNAYIYGQLIQFVRFSDRLEIVLSRPDGVVSPSGRIRAEFVLKTVSGERVEGGYILKISRQSGDSEGDAIWNSQTSETYPDGIPTALYFDMNDVPESGALFEVTATRQVGGLDYRTSSSFTLTRPEIAEILSLVLRLTPSINSDGTIAEGETAILTAHVYDSQYAEVSHCTFGVSRQTDNSAEDSVWNSSHAFTGNQLALTANDLGESNATFTVVASVMEGENVYRKLTGSITLSRVAKQSLSIQLPSQVEIQPYNHVDLLLSPRLLSGNTDITGKTLDSDWGWTIDSGLSEYDPAWNTSHNGQRELHLTLDELPENWHLYAPLHFEVSCNYRGNEVRAIADSSRAYKRFRAGETFIVELNVTMEGSGFADSDFEIQVVDQSGLSTPWAFERSGQIFTLTFGGTQTETMLLGKYRVTLWYRRGSEEQSVLDFYPAFELVATTEEA